MDLRDHGLDRSDLDEVVQLIRERKIEYQPFIFSDDLEVGEGQRFVQGEWSEGVGTISMPNPPSGLEERITKDPEGFHEANGHLRRIYDSFVSFLADELAETLPDLSFAEFGCNSGYFLHALAVKGARECTGYDYCINDRVFSIFNRVLDIPRGRNRFRLSEWDSFHHRCRFGEPKPVDVFLSVAVLCHLADPLHHLAYLCSRSRRAIFVWTPVNKDEGLSLSYGEPEKYYKGLAFPAGFDNEMRPSTSLLRLSLRECGFEDIRELPMPGGLPDPWQDWFREHIGLLALRTSDPVTAYTGGRINRTPRPAWLWGNVRRFMEMNPGLRRLGERWRPVWNRLLDR